MKKILICSLYFLSIKACVTDNGALKNKARTVVINNAIALYEKASKGPFVQGTYFTLLPDDILQALIALLSREPSYLTVIQNQDFEFAYNTFDAYISKLPTDLRSRVASDVVSHRYRTEIFGRHISALDHRDDPEETKLALTRSALNPLTPSAQSSIIVWLISNVKN